MPFLSRTNLIGTRRRGPQCEASPSTGPVLQCIGRATRVRIRYLFANSCFILFANCYKSSQGISGKLETILTQEGPEDNSRVIQQSWRTLGAGTAVEDGNTPRKKKTIRRHPMM